MFGLTVFTGMIVAGVLIGILRTRKAEKREFPSPFNSNPRR